MGQLGRCRGPQRAITVHVRGYIHYVVANYYMNNENGEVHFGGKS